MFDITDIPADYNDIPDEFSLNATYEPDGDEAHNQDDFEDVDASDLDDFEDDGTITFE